MNPLKTNTTLMENTFLSAKLRSVLSALREDLKPELTSPQAKLRADLIDMLLTRITAELETAAEGQAQHQRLSALLASSSGVLAAADTSDPVEHKRQAALVAAIATSEASWRATLEQRTVELASQQPAGKRSSHELDIPNTTFTAYLRKRFPEDICMAAQKMSTIPGGRSKGTVLVDIKGDAGPRSIVIRRDFEASVTGTSVSYEYPIVRAAWDSGLPVPEPLWLEEDATAIGGRFIAFARVPGRAMGTLFSSDASPAFLRGFAATLARMHCIDIDMAGLAEKLDMGLVDHPVQTMVTQFRLRYQKSVPPTPLMDAAFAWLDLQIPAIGQQRALVHGDAGLHNTMGEGDQITALLDWELAHAGDPAEDLAYCKYLVQRLMPWNEFMAVYYEHGGRPVSEERMRFFTVWRTLYLSILTGGARSMFESGSDQDLRIAGIGYNTFPRQLHDLAADLSNFTR